MKTQTQNQVELAAAQELMVEIRNSLKNQKLAVRMLKIRVKDERLAAKQAKAATKAATAKARAERKAARVAKLEAQLARLKEKQNPVGAKAIKAAKRPSPVRILKAA